MTKIRCGNNLGVDISQVIAWKKLTLLNSPEGTEILKLFLVGNSSDFSIASSAIGRPAFNRLYKLLTDRFAVNLTATIDDYAGEAILDRYVAPKNSTSIARPDK
jgi:hypothetical protein